MLTLALVAVAAAGAGVWTATHRWPERAPLESGTMLTEPRPVAPFALVDQDGRPFTPERLQGQWTLLFAGFTHCPDVCPTTLGLMKSLATRLQPAPAMVFLSVDPERDTPARLREYVSYFGAGIQGVTGTKEQLDAFCASLGLAYVKVPGAGEGDYTVDHSAALVLLDPQGRIAAYFQAPHKADTLAADLARVLRSAT